MVERITYMSLRDAYQQKLAAQVEEQRARLSLLKARAKRLAAEGKIIGYEELDHAERSLGDFAVKLKKLAGAGAAALSEVKGGVGKAVGDLTASTKKAAAHLSAATAGPAKRSRKEPKAKTDPAPTKAA